MKHNHYQQIYSVGSMQTPFASLIVISRHGCPNTLFQDVLSCAKDRGIVCSNVNSTARSKLRRLNPIHFLSIVVLLCLSWNAHAQDPCTANIPAGSAVTLQCGRFGSLHHLFLHKHETHITTAVNGPDSSIPRELRNITTRTLWQMQNLR